MTFFSYIDFFEIGGRNSFFVDNKFICLRWIDLFLKIKKENKMKFLIIAMLGVLACGCKCYDPCCDPCLTECAPYCSPCSNDCYKNKCDRCYCDPCRCDPCCRICYCDPCKCDPCECDPCHSKGHGIYEHHGAYGDHEGYGHHDDPCCDPIKGIQSYGRCGDCCDPCNIPEGYYLTSETSFSDKCEVKPCPERCHQCHEWKYDCHCHFGK